MVCHWTALTVNEFRHASLLKLAVGRSQKAAGSSGFASACWGAKLQSVIIVDISLNQWWHKWPCVGKSSWAKCSFQTYSTPLPQDTYCWQISDCHSFAICYFVTVYLYSYVYQWMLHFYIVVVVVVLALLLKCLVSPEQSVCNKFNKWFVGCVHLIGHAWRQVCWSCGM